jgi:hypothetical protein
VDVGIREALDDVGAWTDEPVRLKSRSLVHGTLSSSRLRARPRRHGNWYDGGLAAPLARRSSEAITTSSSGQGHSQVIATGSDPYLVVTWSGGRANSAD